MKLKSNVAISDTGFVFNPASGESFTLNPVGIEILNMLKENKSLENIKDSLLQKYNTDEATLEKDIYDFINLLRNYSLLEDGTQKA